MGNDLRKAENLSESGYADGCEESEEGFLMQAGGLVMTSSSTATTNQKQIEGQEQRQNNGKLRGDKGEYCSLR
ncbi:hypothetical protein AB6A40_009771 [Gnathostoma spinigerum]|uniref:Uncharacterized protein n=1 Tax=Gnathostoma spinigerum TaxID=75299 RepID=A0ABD6F1F9_9BILA